MTDCRIAVLLSCSPTEVRALPAADHDLLCRYYNEEPWGAWRDNMHTAMICREIVRTRNPKAHPELSRWLLINPEKRRRGNLSGFVNMLRAMAGGVRKHISEIKSSKRRRRGRSSETSSTPRSAVRPAPHRTGKSQPKD